MTCDFWWTLICPSLLFVFVCPSVGGLGMLYVLQSARRLVNQSGKSGKRTEINNFRKRALRLYQLGPIPLHPPFKNGFCSSRFSQKGSVLFVSSCPIYARCAYSQCPSISPARHSCVPRPQPVSYLQLRNSQRSRSVLQSSFLRRKNRCVCAVRAHLCSALAPKHSG